jgi:hypothetical protein
MDSFIVMFLKSGFLSFVFDSDLTNDVGILAKYLDELLG